MLRAMLHITLFGAYLIVAAVIGFLLWKTLFVAEKVSDAATNAVTTTSENQRAKKESVGTRTTRSGANPTDHAIANYTGLLALFISVISLFLAYQSVRTAKEVADTARNQLALAYPARLRVTNISMSPKEKIGKAPVLEPGKILEGIVPITNFGREYAVIYDAVCMAYWLKGPLPMNRPYFDKSAGGYCTGLEALIGKGDKMEPGDISIWKFETTVPPEYEPAMSFYVIGFIRYHDRLTPHRFMIFGRKYLPSEDRFVVVDNPDYEGQDFN